MKTHIRTITKNGKTTYMVDIRHDDGRRERPSFKTRKDAEDYQIALQDQRTADDLYLTTTAKRNPALFREFCEQRLRYPKTVQEMVEFTIRAKADKNLRPSYLSHLKYALNSFAKGREETPIAAVTAEEIERWLGDQKGHEGRPASPHTKRGLLNRVSTMFNLAMKRGFIKANPVEQIELPRADAINISVLAPPDASNLLWGCRQNDRPFLPFLVLGMFAGMRSEELMKLKWGDVDISGGQIRVDGTVAKTRSRRVIEMHPTLIAWLKECDRSGIYIFGKGDRCDEKELKRVRQLVKRHRRILCERVGVKLEQNILRNTGSSYLVAIHQDLCKVAYWLGNSPKMIQSHYHGVVWKKDAEVFWALTPENVPNRAVALPPGGKGKKRPGKLIPSDDVSDFQI